MTAKRRSTRVLAILFVALVALVVLACSAPAKTPTTSAPSPTAAPKPATSAPAPSPTAAPKPTTSAPSPAAAPKPEALLKGIRFGAADQTSAAFQCSTAMARIVEKYIPGAKVTAYPTGGGIASMQMLGSGQGEVDSCLAQTHSIIEMYKNEGDWKAKPAKWLPYLTWQFNSIEAMFITRADRTDINSWNDLKGKKVFPQPAASGGYPVIKRVLTDMGIWDAITDRQMDNTAATDALKTGAIDAMVVLSSNQGVPLAWVKQLDLLVSVRPVNPSAAEVKFIEGLPYVGSVRVPPAVFPHGKVSGDIFALNWLTGWYFSPDIDTESIYQLVKTCDQHGKELLSMYPNHIPFTEGEGYKMQAETFSHLAGAGIPIHPGMAKYLKEKGVWKANWTEGQFKKRP